MDIGNFIFLSIIVQLCLVSALLYQQSEVFDLHLDLSLTSQLLSLIVFSLETSNLANNFSAFLLESSKVPLFSAIMATNKSDTNGPSKRVLKIAGISGGVFDRFRSIQDLAKDPSIDGNSSTHTC